MTKIYYTDCKLDLMKLGKILNKKYGFKIKNAKELIKILCESEVKED